MLVLCALFVACCPNLGAQVQQQGTPAQTPAPAPQLPFATQLKKTVGLLTTYVTKDGAQTAFSGTCFFVSYPDDRVGKGQGFVYLVTNRHVASPGIETGQPYPLIGTTLRLNRKGPPGGSDEIVLPLGPQLNWYLSNDAAVDLAVLPFAPDQTNYDVELIPVSLFETEDEVQKNRITEGDSVLFTGYFYQFPGLKKFQPIVREGVLAMMPDEELDTTLHQRGRLYLADLHVFGGNSGSPLFVSLGGFRDGALIAGGGYKLLGVISGYYHEDSNLELTVATTYQATLEQNSGIAMVVPIDALKNLLEGRELKALRDYVVSHPGVR